MNDLNKEEKKINKKLNSGTKTDALLRETSTHYIRQIGDADKKARIMLVVTSVAITVGVTIITKVIHNDHLVWISAAILIIFSVLTLFFAILSVKPELHSNHVAKETENNILHYKKCSEHSLREYTDLMISTLGDKEKKRDAIIKELYYYGNLLAMKYRLIQISYRFFLWGIVLSVTSYLLILLFTQSAMFNPNET